MNRNILKWSFFAGFLYFALMAIAHFFSIKVPVLFVYYDTPFFAYQDKIIAFCVVVYAMLFLAAFHHEVVRTYAIVSMVFTTVGLVGVTMSPDLALVLQEGAITNNNWRIAWTATNAEGFVGLNKWNYWAQVGMISLYTIWLVVWDFATLKDVNKSANPSST